MSVRAGLTGVYGSGRPGLLDEHLPRLCESISKSRIESNKVPYWSRNRDETSKAVIARRTAQPQCRVLVMTSHAQNDSRGGTTQDQASHGSQTITQTAAGPSIPIPPLRLRASEQDRDQQRDQERRIHWDESVVDNEGMGKKSSKVCCIYHRPREPGAESSDSSSSSSDSDDEADLSRAQPANGKSCDHGHGKGKGKAKERETSPNAYERQPKNKGKKAG